MPTRELEKQAKHSGVHTHTCASCLRRVTACGNTASRRRRREAEPESRFRAHIQPQTHKHTHNLADTCTGSLREESFQTELNQGGEICNQVTHCILYRAETNTYAQRARQNHELANTVNLLLSVTNSHLNAHTFTQTIQWASTFTLQKGFYGIALLVSVSIRYTD